MGLDMVGDLKLFFNILFFLPFQKKSPFRYIIFFKVVKYMQQNLYMFVIEKLSRWFPWVTL